MHLEMHASFQIAAGQLKEGAKYILLGIVLIVLYQHISGFQTIGTIFRELNSTHPSASKNRFSCSLLSPE